MTREEARDEILSIESPNILCELPTSFGKTKVALDLMRKRLSVDKGARILIVVPRLVLMDNWREEFVKWGVEDYLPFTEFVTYVSLPKKAGTWDMIIFDEVHHLSERCRDSINDFDVKFDKPEKEISFTFNMINKSESDAYILHYNKPKIGCVDDNDLCINNLDKIEYTFTYEDGNLVKINDVIKAQEEKKVIIKIKYKNNKEEVPMSLTQLGFSLTFAKVK